VDKAGATSYDISLLFSLHSVLFAVLFGTLFALVYRGEKILVDIKKTSKRAWIAIIMFGLFASGLFIVFRFLGLAQSSGTFATLGQVITTSLTAILAFIILRERLAKQFWLFFVLIILATYVVSTNSVTLSTPKVGDLFILLAAFFLAIANIFAKIAIPKTTPIVLSVGRFCTGAIFFILATMLLFGAEALFSEFSYWSILSGFFWTVNILAFSFAISRIGITLATSVLMFAPIITMILEITLLKQHFSLLQIVAGLVVVSSGVMLLITASKVSRN